MFSIDDFYQLFKELFKSEKNFLELNNKNIKIYYKKFLRITFAIKAVATFLCILFGTKSSLHLLDINLCQANEGSFFFDI